MSNSTNKILLGILILLGLITLLAIVPALFAFPGDGLEHVGEEESFSSSRDDAFELGIANDYDFLGLGESMGDLGVIISTILSAVIGSAIVACIFFLPLLIVKKKPEESKIDNS